MLPSLDLSISIDEWVHPILAPQYHHMTAELTKESQACNTIESMIVTNMKMRKVPWWELRGRDRDDCVERRRWKGKELKFEMEERRSWRVCRVILCVALLQMNLVVSTSQPLILKFFSRCVLPTFCLMKWQREMEVLCRVWILDFVIFKMKMKKKRKLWGTNNTCY